MSTMRAGSASGSTIADYDVDMGTELASTSVTLLLIGPHVFVTLSENGGLLRELLLNPDHDYRPE